jgi:hypothetical protein
MSKSPPTGVTGPRKETENGMILLSAKKYKDPEKNRIPKTKNLKTTRIVFEGTTAFNPKASKHDTFDR